MDIRRSILIVLVLGLLLASGFLLGCEKGPETDLTLRVVISARWDDPPRLRGIDPQGREYIIFVKDTTEINSGEASAFAWDDIILGDDLKVWINLVDPDPDPPHYDAVRMDIAPTTR